MRTIDDMVRQEVHYCVSALVSTLAQGWADPMTGPGTRNIAQQMNDLRNLHVQASELAAPVDDWEEAAVQAGALDCRQYRDKGDIFQSVPEWTFRGNRYETTQEVCEANGLDPYQWEVFEHWIVSDWLAQKLAEHGEKVDTDFAGMTVWARCTTGQAISMDGVMQRIYQEASK